jgi:adenylylsulfate kinase
VSASDRGVVVWLTGLPSSGKSTLSAKIATALRGDGIATVELDGDAVRAAIVPAHGYDDASRDAFYETLARLAALLALQGLVVLVPATAHRAAFRDRARAMAPRFVLVFVDVPVEECARRDAKGLYARATPGLPGSTATYERPTDAALVVHGQDGDVERVVERVRRSASD